MIISVFAALLLGGLVDAQHYINIPLQKIVSDEPILSKRQISNSTLVLNAQSSGYLANITIGTPSQNLQLILDTGSPLTWINAKNVSLFTPGKTATAAQATAGAAICQTNSCLDPSSSTLRVPSNSTIFDIMYVDGTESIGRIVQDAMTFQGLSDSTFQFGLVEYFYSPGGTASSLGGILGLSPPNPVLNFNNLSAALTAQSTTQTSSYFVPQTILQQLQDAGAINTNAFSLYLSDGTDGQLTIGGVDSGRYSGPLTVLPIEQDTNANGQSYYVTLQSVGYAGSTSNQIQVGGLFVLDSGTTSTYLPATVVEQLATDLGGYFIPYSSSSGLLAIPCGSQTTIDFYFSNSAVIRVPTSEILQGQLTSAQARRLGLNAAGNICILSLFGTADSDSYLLGDSFLRSAYVVYDLQAGNIAIAQASYTGTSSLKAIGSGQFGIPGGVYNSSSPGASNSAVVPSATKTLTLASGIIRTSVAGGATLTFTASTITGTAATGTTTPTTAGTTNTRSSATKLHSSSISWYLGTLFVSMTIAGFFYA